MTYLLPPTVLLAAIATEHAASAYPVRSISHPSSRRRLAAPQPELTPVPSNRASALWRAALSLACA